MSVCSDSSQKVTRDLPSCIDFGSLSMFSLRCLQMQRPLREHIASLEEKIEALKAQQNDPGRSADERYQSSIDLRFAERALEHFRAAYELEQKISGVRVLQSNGRGVTIH